MSGWKLSTKLEIGDLVKIKPDVSAKECIDKSIMYEVVGFVDCHPDYMGNVFINPGHWHFHPDQLELVFIRR